MSFASVQQVKRTIRGTVVDNTGLPVIGANVIVKGSAGVGTVTNVDVILHWRELKTVRH